jgi:hypothetical protein
VAAGSVELNEDEAGPSATRPQPGASWQPEGHPMLQPPEEQRPQSAQWKTWLWPHESAEGLPPLRILLVWENLAGHLTPDLLGWLFEHGVMPLYTPLGGSWPSTGRIGATHHCAASPFRSVPGIRPEQIIDWLEQTVAGWNHISHPVCLER